MTAQAVVSVSRVQPEGTMLGVRGEAIDPAAKTIRAKALIIWAQQDLTVYSEPARTLARLINADTFEFSGDCGHLSFLCEGEALRDKVNRFMQ